MPKAKYQQFFDQMLLQNQQLFADFEAVQQKSSTTPEVAKDQFNSLGKQVLSVIRDWERRLCQHTERGGYSQYSGNLAEKFWQLVRQKYPSIDMVGMK